MEAPRKIYLQLGESTESFNELGATWCSDRIDKTDIEYVIALPEISDEEIEKSFKMIDNPYNRPYISDVNRRNELRLQGAKWMQDRLSAKTKGKEWIKIKDNTPPIGRIRVKIMFYSPYFAYFDGKKFINEGREVKPTHWHPELSDSPNQKKKEEK